MKSRPEAWSSILFKIIEKSNITEDSTISQKDIIKMVWPFVCQVLLDPSSFSSTSDLEYLKITLHSNLIRISQSVNNLRSPILLGLVSLVCNFCKEITF